MSFLNPVSEPVKRFSSTDAGAPQINYNARVAGDVKTVLKACLVTGYGAKESAGWSIANEVDHVAEFVSPSVAMSDYRLGIDDSSAASTTWYYQYQDARVNPNKNVPSKNFSNVNKLSTENSWELIVTERGFYFVEILYHTTLAAKVARITWFGQLKSALMNDNGVNISFFCVGIGSQIPTPSSLMIVSDTYDVNKTYNLAAYTALSFNTTNSVVFTKDSAANKYSGLGIDVVSDVFLSNGTAVVAQQSGILFKNISNLADAYGVEVMQLDGRNVLSTSVAYNNMSDAKTNGDHVKKMLIRLDYLEY